MADRWLGVDDGFDPIVIDGEIRRGSSLRAAATAATGVAPPSEGNTTTAFFQSVQPSRHTIESAPTRRWVSHCRMMSPAAGPNCPPEAGRTYQMAAGDSAIGSGAATTGDADAIQARSHGVRSASRRSCPLRQTENRGRKACGGNRIQGREGADQWQSGGFVRERIAAAPAFRTAHGAAGHRAASRRNPSDPEAADGNRRRVGRKCPTGSTSAEFPLRRRRLAFSRPARTDSNGISNFSPHFGTNSPLASQERFHVQLMTVGTVKSDPHSATDLGTAKCTNRTTIILPIRVATKQQRTVNRKTATTPKFDPLLAARC